MENRHDKRSRLFPVCAGGLLLFGALSVPYLFRPVWFDEALTILNFALMDSPAAI